MKFCNSSRTLKSGKTYYQNIHPEMYVSAENSTNATEQSDANENIGTNAWISTELVMENIKANLEPLS